MFSIIAFHFSFHFSHHSSLLIPFLTSHPIPFLISQTHPFSNPSMNDINIILKELLVDWDNVISSNFNPLVYALAINNNSAKAVEFRDMYHKLEFAMETIIKTNYKGFSDSILSYNMFNSNNKESLRCLENINQCIEVARSENFGIEEILKEHRSVKSSFRKSVFCNSINRVRELSKMFDEIEDLHLRSKYIVEALDLIENPEYLQIQGVEDYKKVLLSKYQAVSEAVNEKLGQYIFDDKNDNLRYFDCIIRLGSLKVFDSYLNKNFRRGIFESIEGIILNAFKNKLLKIEGICFVIGKKMERIKESMYVLIDKALAYFEINPENEKVLSVRNSGLKLSINAGEVLKVIKRELESFIASYTRHDNLQQASFDLNSVLDNLDYSKEFSANNQISEKFVSESSIVVDAQMEYVAVTAPSRDVAYYLMQAVRDAELRSLLAERHRELNQGDAMTKEKRRLEKFVDVTLFEMKRTRDVEIFVANFKEDLRKNEHLKKIVTELICEVLTRKHGEYFGGNPLLGSMIEKRGNKSERKGSSSDRKSANEQKGGIENFAKSEEFRQFITSKAIPQKKLFLNKNRYQSTVCIIYFLREMDSLLVSKDVESVFKLYFYSFALILQLEVMYYYDLFYRQGNARSNINAIANIFKNVSLACDHLNDFGLFEGLYDTIEYYSLDNVAAMGVGAEEDLVEFLENVQILDEIIGVMVPGQSLNKMREFFNGVLEGTNGTEKGKLLRKRLNRT